MPRPSVGDASQRTTHEPTRKGKFNDEVITQGIGIGIGIFNDNVDVETTTNHDEL